MLRVVDLRSEGCQGEWVCLETRVPWVSHSPKELMHGFLSTSNSPFCPGLGLLINSVLGTSAVLGAGTNQHLGWASHPGHPVSVFSALGEPGSRPLPCSTPSLLLGGGRDAVAMAGWPQLASAQRWLVTQACLCPAGFLIYAGILHEQCLDSEPLAKYSRFFRPKDFLRGPGSLPGFDSFCVCPMQIAICI